MVIKIAICDDSEEMRGQIIRMLDSYFADKELSYTADEYCCGEDLILSLKEYNLIFMDYKFNSTQMDGIEASRILRSRQCFSTLVFLTSYPDAVYESFEVNAFRFLIKPLDEKKFYAVMDAFLESRIRTVFFHVHSDGTTYYLDQREISFVEGSGKDSIIHFITKTSEILCHETLLSIEKRMSGDYFFRCYRSFIINLMHVKGYDRHNVFMKDESVIPLSRNKYRELMAVHSDFLANHAVVSNKL